MAEKLYVHTPHPHVPQRVTLAKAEQAIKGLLGRHAELMAEEQFNTTMNTYHDIGEIMQHLSAQDAELLKQTKMLIHLLNAAGINPEQLPDLQINGAASPQGTLG
jgi:hypothetical protein